MENEKTYLSKGSYIITDLGELSDKLTLSVYRNRVQHNPYDRYRDLVGGLPFHLNNEADSTITGGKVENEQATDFAGFNCGIDVYNRNWRGDMFRDDTGAIFDDELIPDVDT